MCSFTLPACLPACTAAWYRWFEIDRVKACSRTEGAAVEEQQKLLFARWTTPMRVDALLMMGEGLIRNKWPTEPEADSALARAELAKRMFASLNSFDQATVLELLLLADSRSGPRITAVLFAGCEEQQWLEWVTRWSELAKAKLLCALNVNTALELFKKLTDADQEHVISQMQNMGGQIGLLCGLEQPPARLAKLVSSISIKLYKQVASSAKVIRGPLGSCF